MYSETLIQQSTACDKLLWGAPVREQYIKAGFHEQQSLARSYSQSLKNAYDVGVLP